MIKAKMEVNTGIEYEKTFDRVIPRWLTAKAKRAKAPIDAKIARRTIGVSDSTVWVSFKNPDRSKIRKRGRNSNNPITFCT
mgnify:CR=1 FL=1